MTDLLILPPALGVLGMVVAIIIYMIVKTYDPGSDALKKIADAIHEGAMVFMKREYTQLAIFALVLVVAIYFSLGSSTAIAFLAGAFIFSLRRLVRYVYRDTSQRAHNQRGPY